MGERQAEFMRIPAIFMRGGTSKGVYLMAEDLPSDPVLRDQVILDIFGSPDLRQINGIGGADPLTSKVAILSPSKRPGIDIEYTFGYVGIGDATVDYDGNCGNISSGVGVFAIKKGIVSATEGETKVVIFNTNTGKVIEAMIPVRNGEVSFEGDYAIAGVPGTGSKIVMNFPNSAGSKTGKLLPTGNVRDRITLADGRTIEVSLVDAANPSVFFKAMDVGFSGREMPSDCERDPSIIAVMEDIRGTAAIMMGLAASRDEVGPAVPKVAFVSPATSYQSSDGEAIREADIDLVARTMAMGKMHKTYAVTGGICLAAAALIDGTVVNDLIGARAKTSGEIRIGHPTGFLEVFVDLRKKEGSGWELAKAGVSRTARPIMDGYVYASRRAFLPRA